MQKQFDIGKYLLLLFLILAYFAVPFGFSIFSVGPTAVRTSTSVAAFGNTMLGNLPAVRRTTANFDSVATTTLANVTGLTFDVVAGKAYRFRFKCNTSLAAAGGEKYAIAGTATATNINYSIISITTGAAIPIAAQHTALGGNSSNGGYTASMVIVEGAILVNAAGTLTVQFAQSSASGTSSILTNATFELLEAV
jgi:hypothetical protein